MTSALQRRVNCCLLTPKPFLLKLAAFDEFNFAASSSYRARFCTDRLL